MRTVPWVPKRRACTDPMLTDVLLLHQGGVSILSPKKTQGAERLVYNPEHIIRGDVQEEWCALQWHLTYQKTQPPRTLP